MPVRPAAQLPLERRKERKAAREREREGLLGTLLGRVKKEHRRRSKAIYTPTNPSSSSSAIRNLLPTFISQLKQFKPPPEAASSSMGGNTVTQASKISITPPPPPKPPKESFARRYRFLWPLLLAVNLSVGAYIFMRTKKKDEVIEEGAVPTTSAAAVAASVSEIPVTPATVTEPVKLREPIPVDQQRELFKWLLEEKRKVKTKDGEEKKHIEEEKALLKQFIRSKSIPSL